MKRSTWFFFVVFCGLSSSVWLLPSSETSTLSPMLQDGMAYLLAAIAAGITVRRTNRATSIPLGPISTLAAFSVCLFAAPIMALNLIPYSPPSGTLVAIFAVIPAVVAVVVQTYSRSAHGLLEPALAGLAGVLLLLSVELPGSTSRWLAGALILATVVLAGMISVGMYARFCALGWQDRRLGIVAVCLTNALVLLLYTIARNGIPTGRPNLIGLAVETASVLLLVTLVSRMPPVLLSTRFFLVPLLTAVNSYILMRPELNPRIFLGALLLAGGSTFLLLWGNQKDNNVSALSLR